MSGKKPKSDELTDLRRELEVCRQRNRMFEQKMALFNLIESNIHDVLVIMDPDLNRLYVSPSVYWQRGYTVEEVLNQPLSDSVTPESYERIEATLKESLGSVESSSDGVPVTRRLELTLYHRDGSLIDAEANVALHTDSDGRPAYLVAVTRDITDRKKIEKLLRDSEIRYRSLFTNTLEALSILKDGNIVDANRQWLKIHGYDDREEVIGRNIMEFVHPGHHEDMLKRREANFEDAQPRQYEMMDIRKDRSMVYVEVKSNTIRFDDEPYVLSAIRDITESRRIKLQMETAHQALRDKTDDLERANKELSRYAFAVSHELKAPVRSVYSLISLLEADTKGSGTRQQKEYIAGIRAALGNLRKTIEGMLDLSRISSKDQPLKAVHIKTIIPDVFRRIQNLDGELDLPMEWPVVQGEPFLLTQILSNLITNGFKFNQSRRKRVWVTWRRHAGGKIEITVEDNGIGIEPDYVDTIFETFTRLHTREEYEGSGIGLAIVKRAVHRISGMIRVESTPGEGSRFILTLQEWSR